MEPQSPQNPSKNIINLTPRKDGPTLTVSSNFDSGNAGKIQIGPNNSIIITPANDCSSTQYQSHAKGWFYFSVLGAPIGYRQKFIIKKMNQLSGQAKYSQYFKPVFRYNQENWQRIEQTTTTNKQDETQLQFQIKFEKISQIFIAYSYPFSYEECQSSLKEYKILAKQNYKTIYYHQELLINSPQGRSITLLTLTSFHDKLSVRQSPINEYMFNGKANRSFKFGQNKKTVLITARVHPGQAPSSHTMNGIIKFLLSKDARAELLRRNFVFKIVPMLNPDGVYHGHYRMDIFNQNLNRFYLDPDPFKQPSAFAIRNLGQYYKIQGTLAFYLDLHAHPQKKGNFIYGNSLEKIQQQVKTQLFPKILSMNCVQFDYQSSCFSKNHMTLKDRNEDLTKQGCGRVVFQKVLDQIYSYTMECGYTSSNYLNQLSSLSTPHRKVDRLGLIPDDIDNIKSIYYTEKKHYLTIRAYQNLGRCVCISILDLFEKNPYSRIFNSYCKTISGVEEMINDQLTKNTKDYKSYVQKIGANLSVRNQRKKLNRFNPNISIAKTLPKTNLVLQKKIFSSKYIEKQKVKQRQKIRRRTLPKMRN